MIPIKLIIQITIVLSLLQGTLSAQTVQVEKLWETEKEFLKPESVVYDSARKRIYVSNYNRFPKQGEIADDCISILDLEGNTIERKWISGLKAPTGITIHSDQLFIVERDGISTYSIESGVLIQKHSLIHTGFLNDISIDKNGVIYFTDSSPANSETTGVYAIRNGMTDTVMHESIERANGLLYNQGKLVVGNSGDRFLKEIDLAERSIRNIARLDTGIIDGIKVFNEKDYLVSLWEGKLFLISSEGVIEELLDTKKEKINIADFEFIEELNVIIIPTYGDNRILAYRIKEK